MSGIVRRIADVVHMEAYTKSLWQTNTDSHAHNFCINNLTKENKRQKIIKNIQEKWNTSIIINMNNKHFFNKSQEPWYFK